MGIPEIEAKRYEDKIKQGNILISVHTENSAEIKRAKDVLKMTNAEDISSTGESSADSTTTNREFSRGAGSGR